MATDLKVEKECPKCHGHGKIANKDCDTCNGTGTILTEDGLKILNYLRNSIRISEH
ncbi:tryptophan RNA-binding attenuator protein inhibitory protein [Sporomusaceae bacterium FL31]|nr:tryptophan RNA-binding attenuator protein inhibitory protein [Sporomusaceae bacterium FL31]GCE35653.1 tryptophan RNA-binding attenuator protein inhibitory protein [Sporomusaceae bacterium]